MKTNRTTLRKKNIFDKRDDALRNDITMLCVQLQNIKNIWTEEWFKAIADKNLDPIDLDEDGLDSLSSDFDMTYYDLQRKIAKKVKVHSHLRHNIFAEARDDKNVPFNVSHDKRLERLGLGL